MDFAPSTDLRRNLGDYIERLKQGETFVVLHRGEPVGELVPFRGERRRAPAWKQALAPVPLMGESLAKTIRAERDE